MKAQASLLISALLVPQDGKRAQCAAEVATGAREDRPAGDLDGRDARRRVLSVRSFRDGLCGEISEGNRNAEEGPGEPTGLLRPEGSPLGGRLPGRALAASANDQRDRVNLRDRASPDDSHAQLRFAA